jgi:hypothetical protein
LLFPFSFSISHFTFYILRFTFSRFSLFARNRYAPPVAAV